MNQSKLKLTEISIKWKLTLWSACLMIMLFLSFNIIQYFFIQHWLISQEKQAIQTKMDEVLAYLKAADYDQKNVAIKGVNEFLDKINQESQMIRIVGQDGQVVFTASEDFPDDDIIPKNVNHAELVELKNDDERLLILRSPFTNGHFSGSVEIGRSIEKSDELMKYFLIVMIIGGVGAIGLSVLGGRLISHQLLKPVNNMVDTMKRIKQNGLQERVAIGVHHDEITDLGMMFNDLMDDVEYSFNQQKQFVEDASHELKTPLTIIHGHLSLIKRWGKEDPKVLERSIGLSLKEVDRLITLVAELLELSKVEENHEKATEAINPNEVIESVLENFKIIHHDFGIRMHDQADEHVRIEMPTRYLEQILLIVLDNAVKFSNKDKIIEVKTMTENQFFLIEIKDYGMGIPEQDLPYVLNRFYRVDKARSRKSGGSGLGLSIANRLVENYGGRIYLASSEEEWTTITIQLPIKAR